MNAQANTVKGMGYELGSVYSQCVIEFQNIANIHVMRESLRKLLKTRDGESSGWLEHIRRVRKTLMVDV